MSKIKYTLEEVIVSDEHTCFEYYVGFPKFSMT